MRQVRAVASAGDGLVEVSAVFPSLWPLPLLLLSVPPQAARVSTPAVRARTARDVLRCTARIKPPSLGRRRPCASTGTAGDNTFHTGHSLARRCRPYRCPQTSSPSRETIHLPGVGSD